MTINSEFFANSEPAVALEMFSAGWCNLQCKYCYIPKTDFLKTVHSNIIERIKDGRLLNDVEKMFGKDLESLSHWGTEPTLTTSLFKEFYEQAFLKFPKLNKIFLSSNFMTPTKNIINFVNEIVPRSKRINISIQMSLDGPSWLTDINRGVGSTEKIKNNIKEFFRHADLDTHEITCNFKPTICDDEIEKLSDIKKLSEYYRFFDDLMTEIFEIVGDRKIGMSRFVNPTVAVPWNYTKKDGINFYKIHMNQKELAEKEKYNYIFKPDSFYQTRYIEKLNHMREFHIKQKMFTCSAGDSCFGAGDIDNLLYSCHRSFYLIYDEYRNACKEWPLDAETMEGMACGRDKVLKDLTTTDYKNRLETAKVLYVNRAYHDFAKHRITSSVAMLRQLAEIGQISKIYKDLYLSSELAKFVLVGMCQMDNVMASSTFEVPSFALFKLFGNGTFEQIIKDYIKKQKEGK